MSIRFAVGFLVPIYVLRIWFAVVNQLAWDKLPGCRFENSSLHFPVEIAIVASSKYFWSVLSSAYVIDGKPHFIALKFSMGSSVDLCRAFPIGPVNVFGPHVSPSKCLNKWRSGSSFKCYAQISHCKGLFKFKCSSNWRIIPVLWPIFETVPSDPTSNCLKNKITF